MGNWGRRRFQFSISTELFIAGGLAGGLIGLIQIAKSKDAFFPRRAAPQRTEHWSPGEPTLNLGTNTVIDCVTLERY